MSTATPTQAEVDAMRAEQLVEVNTSPVPSDRMTTDQARELFEFLSFAAPYVVVRRRSDGVKGTLTFTHSPRFYFGFVPSSR